MPIYEYRCNHCGEITEILTGVHSQDIPKCRGCGGANLEKLMSASFYTLKEGDRASGTTCCGKTERCETPPCSNGGTCRRN